MKRRSPRCTPSWARRNSAAGWNTRKPRAASRTSAAPWWRAILGGVLGHQVGSGRGNDVATVGGAIAGGAIGSNVGRDGGTRDVQRCDTARQGNPAYWDVTYDFRGIQHRVQMSAPPGGTVAVNENGEPRG